MSVKLKQKPTEEKAMVMTIEDELEKVQKALERETKMKNLLLKKVKDLTSTQESMRNQMVKIQDGKEDFIDILQKQKMIINELLVREPEKVKKLKAQKSELLQQQLTLKSQLDTCGSENKKMANEKEKLKSQLKIEKDENELLHEEIKQLKANISTKEEVVVSQKEMLESVQEGYNNLFKEELRLKSLLAENDLINCNLRDEIERLKEKLEVNEKENDKACEQLKETVLILFKSELKEKAENGNKEVIISKLQEGILKKDSQLLNIQQDIEKDKDRVAKSIAEIAIKNAQKLAEKDEMFTHIENERNALHQKITSLESDKDDANKRINEVVSKLHEAEVKLHEAEVKFHDMVSKFDEAEAIAEKKLVEAEAEVKAAAKKRAMITEMLHASEGAKSELIKVNKRMQEEIFLQDGKIAAIEAKVQNIFLMAKSETKRNEHLIEEICGVESHMHNIEGKMEQKKKSKVKRMFPFFARRK